MKPSIVPATFRDLTLLPAPENQTYVIACDSCGGVGMKSGDCVKVPPEITGYFTASVTLSEIISLGAKPLFIINNLCAEMNDTGLEINRGINRALKELGLDDELLITGSTEENMPMVQTALGLTVLGLIETPGWTVPVCRKHWHLFAAGVPKVGQEVTEDGGCSILTLPDYRALSALAVEKDLLPVGSKGIRYEAELMALGNSLTIEWEKDIPLDLESSAGPVTCAILALGESDIPAVKNVFRKSLVKLGRFI